MQLNLCPNEVTGYSPIEIEYGLQGINPNVHVDIVSKNLKNLEEIRHDVRRSIEYEKETRVAKTDRHFVPYCVGDKVLMKALPSSNY
jgi:lipoate synthase